MAGAFYIYVHNIPNRVDVKWIKEGGFFGSGPWVAMTHHNEPPMIIERQAQAAVEEVLCSRRADGNPGSLARAVLAAAKVIHDAGFEVI